MTSKSYENKVQSSLSLLSGEFLLSIHVLWFRLHVYSGVSIFWDLIKQAIRKFVANDPTNTILLDIAFQ